MPRLVPPSPAGSVFPSVNWIVLPLTYRLLRVLSEIIGTKGFVNSYFKIKFLTIIIPLLVMHSSSKSREEEQERYRKNEGWSPLLKAAA